MARGTSARHRMAHRQIYGRNTTANDTGYHGIDNANTPRFYNSFSSLSDAESQESGPGSIINEESQITVNASMKDENACNVVTITLENILTNSPDDQNESGETLWAALISALHASPTKTLSWTSPAFLREQAAENLSNFCSVFPFHGYSAYGSTIKKFFHLVPKRTHHMKLFREYLRDVRHQDHIDVSAPYAQTTLGWWPKDDSQWSLPPVFEQREGGSVIYWVQRAKLMKRMLGRNLSEEECIAYLPSVPRTF